VAAETLGIGATQHQRERHRFGRARSRLRRAGGE